MIMRMPVPSIVGLSLSVAIATSACRPPAHERAAEPRSQDPALIAEARAFMDAYARDLLAGDRPAIASRYDRTGAYIVIEGGKSFLSHDAIAARYAGAGWSPPASFEWRDLSFDPVGSDAVAVIGSFLWTRQGEATPVSISYTALLKRQDGELRIRVEDEKRIPAR